MLLSDGIDLRQNEQQQTPHLTPDEPPINPPASNTAQSLSSGQRLSLEQQHAQQVPKQHVGQGQVGACRVLNNFRRIFAPYERPHRVALNSTFQPRLKHQRLKLKESSAFFQ